VWHILASNLLIGVGIGFGFAAMPLLIMQSVPQSETGASNGLNALFRSLGTTAAAAVMGAVLAASSTVEGGAQIPTAAGFQLTYLLAGGGAALALALALLIPVHQPLGENHLALPR
jgi:MFS family permease